MNEQAVQDLIIDALKSWKRGKLKRRQLFNLLDLQGIEYEEFKEIIAQMEKSGSIIFLKDKGFRVPEDVDIFTGIFSTMKSGDGYIRTEKGESFAVKKFNTMNAVTGDTVRAKIIHHRHIGLNPAARIIEIVERTTRPIVGIYKDFKGGGIVTPQGPAYASEIAVKKGSEGGASDGDMVVAKVSVVSGKRPLCEITEVLGDPDKPGVDVLAIAKRYQLPLKFPAAVLEEAASVPAEITDEILSSKRDIRDLVTFTIDPVDAKDFDDAISIKKNPDGFWELGVHIADVSHYVKPEGPMDVEAQRRGMSCYLVDRVIPMLPERLSNDLCSLRPETDRLTKSIFARIDPYGEIVSYEAADTIIHSRMRLNYEQVQDYLNRNNGDGAGEIKPEVGEALKELSALTDILIARRMERGALDFELPETRVVLDDNGHPVDIRKRVRLKSHRMVEEAMLMANTVVALMLMEKKAPLLYRVHDEPNPEKLEIFSEAAQAFGAEFSISKASSQIYIQKFLQSLSGKPFERILNSALLRSMKKAVYTPFNNGHYGLALPVYAHFTSPIRRYPDLIVHRQMKKHLLAPISTKKESPIEFYESLGDSITEREIVTDSAERDSIKMKTAEYMHSHLGEEFTGTITDVIPIGFFVELDTIFVEGLVHVSSLQNDYYEIDRNGVALVGRNRGERFTAGDRVKVVVSAADKERGRVDFALLGIIGKRAVKISGETASKNKKNERKPSKRTAVSSAKKSPGYGRPGRRRR